MPEVGGIDIAWTKPSPSAVRACGYSFVLGYLSQDPTKDLTASLLAGYVQAGLMAGVVWETTADRALSGAEGGAADGAAAEAKANAIGYGVDNVIFAAVDFDANGSQIAGPIAQYLTAFNAACRRPIGVYGSFAVIEALVTPGQQPVRYGWQTAAWSGGQLSGKAHIYQRAGHVNWPLIPGVPANAFDEDVLCIPLPLMGAAPVPAPAPAPPPPPPAPVAVASSFRCEYGQTSPAIARMQGFLAHSFPGYVSDGLPPLPATGYYGDITTAWVADFAHRCGIGEADGRNVGPKIAAALSSFGFQG